MNRKMLVSLGTILLATAILLTLLTLLAQSDSAAPQPARAAPLAAVPAVLEVDPASAPNDLDTPIVISGTDFVVSATVLLDDTALDDVGWVCTTTLTATVPWGTAPGVYTVTVENPGEGSGSQPDAFTVTQGIGIFTTNGPYGGYIVGIEKKPGTPTMVYALAFGVGLFVSEDSGAHWELNLVSGWPLDLAFDAQNANVIYYGSDNGIFRTMDGGDTWDVLPEFLDDCYQIFPAAHPSLAGVVYVGVGSCPGIPFPLGKGGVFRSDDYGMNWITKTNGMTDTNVHSIAIHPNDPDKMLAGTWNENLYVSTDGGENWSLSARLDGPVIGVYFNPYQPLEAWATASTPIHGAPYLYTSTNLTDWTPVIIDPSAGGWLSRWDLTFLTDTIWASSGAAYTSTDGGFSWAEVPGLHHGAIAIAVTPENPQEIYVGTQLGVDKSEDGGQSWQQINEGLAGIVPRTIAVARTEPDSVYVDTNQGLFRSLNGGRAWQDLEYGGGGAWGDWLVVDPYTPTRVYLGKAGCADAFCLEISTDAAETWHLVTATLPVTYAGWESTAYALAPHPQVPGRILAGSWVWQPDSAPWLEDTLAVVYASDDYGQSWAYMGPTQPISPVMDIAYDAVDPDLVYMVTAGTGQWKSTDGGVTWSALPLTLAGGIFDEIAPHPSLSGHLILSTSDQNNNAGLFSSQDAGETWTLLTDTVIVGSPLVYAPTIPPTLYAFGIVGDSPDVPYVLRRSVDNGLTWETVEGAPGPTRLATATDGERVVLYVGTPGGMVAQFTPEEMLLGAGVYRWTSLLPTNRVYLPLILKGYAG
ncbi:MAG: IPT/TIG domain-containing protein [Chloroflexota bacterium]|nr:IPT/TIG domain-containing protein [Chloroflexota bacterium]